MPLLGRQLEDLKAGVFQLECVMMTLSNGDPEDPKMYEGPGEIRLDEEGQLRLVLYDQRFEPDLGSIVQTDPSGTWVAQSAFFDLQATYLLGRSWVAENLHPDTSSSSSQVGAVVRAHIQSLSQHTVPKRDGRDWMWLYFANRIETPANLATFTTIQEGDEKPRRGFERNIWALQCADIDIKLRRGDSGFELNVLSKAPLREQLDTRIEEAVWFTLGQPITSDVVQYRIGDRERLVIRSRVKSQRVRSAFTPFHLRSVDAPSVLSRVFCRYLKFVSAEDRARFHPLSVILKRALNSTDGTVEDRALAFCIAVEGVVRLGFAHLGRPDEETLEAANKLESHLGDVLADTPLAPRVAGFLRLVRGSSARSALRSLVHEGTISQDQFEAWETLRHVPAHGREYDRPFREVYDLALKIQVMLSRLVLALIEYEGPYTDYGTLGWPTRQTNDCDAAT